MAVILGIDPGSVCTGYGLIYTKGNKHQCLAHGFIRPKTTDIGDRLYEIHTGLCQVIDEFNPDEVSIEKIFTHRNPQSALKLGQARGVALVAAARYAFPVFEYTPRQIKLAVSGYGAATKEQVQQMISTLLELKSTPQADAADALAIALCHCQTRRLTQRIAVSTVSE